jgi:acetyl esterase/lipase
MYSVLLDFYRELEAEVQAKRPQHIFVTGHSLGAGLASMVGLRLQKYLDYTPSVDVIGFGGPNTGDAEFAEAFRASVNSRHVIFLGRGNAPDPGLYTAGDVCAQYTWCGWSCPPALVGGGGD